MRTQAEKGSAFRALHERDSAFIIPNPWDVGRARLLAQLGFEALATTSAGYAFSVGQRDNTIGRDKIMAPVDAIASATDLPVSADLENGFGDDPALVAETIRLAAAAGLVGGSIEMPPIVWAIRFTSINWRLSESVLRQKRRALSPFLSR